MVCAATARFLSLSTCCLANLLSYVRTVDSVVAVLAMHFFPRISLSELWVCLGSGKKVCDTPSMTLAPIWDLPGLLHCHFSTHLRGATRRRSSLDVARKLLKLLGILAEYSRTHRNSCGINCEWSCASGQQPRSSEKVGRWTFVGGRVWVGS